MRVDSVLGNLDPKRALRLLFMGLRNGLTFEENFRAKRVDVADSGAANTDITVAHNLGRVPAYYLWNIDRNGVVYDQNKAGWTTTTMTLRCSAANAIVTLVVF